MSEELQMIIAIALFVLVYYVIISEKFHKTISTLIGAVLLIISGVITQEEAVSYIDFNTIGLLFGMMALVAIIKQTGLFEYIAIKLAKLSKGEPAKILVYFMVITAVLSALLDNVTTIIVIVPVTLYICSILEINPIGFVISEIFASNLGGTATMIGDPPNIMIGSATHLTFSDFFIKLAPVSLISLIVCIIIFKLIYRKDMRKAACKEGVMELQENDAIKDKSLLIKSLSIMILVITALFLHGLINIPSATIAVAGAAILIAIAKIDLKEVFAEIEWPTILFFIGLFILVGGLEKTGVLKYIAEEAFRITGGNLLLSGLAILWISAIVSAFIDNIPFVATMIPMVKVFGQMSGTPDIDFLWWCLALGACFGGNGTIIGASANVLGIDITKNEGYQISFKSYFKIAFPLMIITVIIASIYGVLVLY